MRVLQTNVFAKAVRKLKAGQKADLDQVINRVDYLDEMLAHLRSAGVDVVGGSESHENGKFVWIMSPCRQQGRAV